MNKGVAAAKEAAKYIMKKQLQKRALLLFFCSLAGLITIVVCVVIVCAIGIISGLSGSHSGGGGSGDSAINIAPEVEQYRAAVAKECKANDIPELVDLILALIMQESGGKSLDVMQASESKGLPPNSITDPHESIKVGVANFASVYKSAKAAKKNVKETALQGYNFGSGYINWAIKKSGGWTKDNAADFARIHSNGRQRPNGTWMYGDQLYVEHVMRYLKPNNGENGGQTDVVKGGNKVIETAIKEGSAYIGRSTYVMGGGRNQSDILKGVFDCSSFVHYAFNKAGLSLGNLASTTTDTLVMRGKKVKYSNIKRGDLVFFDTYKVNGHVGIYLGNGEFLNCQNSYGVSVAKMNNSYWKSHFNGVVVRITE
ncbi:bifunctional lytic transglycosylase/C40 family peptidase (plasmid) [Bacillus velezensis]|uniref:bifunctional lytic transglycosylase/C40 family peptidase n=1 Tax=Bacillus TaxID=1386 RepID=UPI0004A02934|nr:MULTISPECIES: bifunctional lytic transglycosylase/C40 family peptidase [Bacillus amyloliquefaciens group]KDN91250.1 lytic transglycosylase [Bacillus amyloliquefaciens]QYC35293.1 lysozyme family protein [Bacillus amyloliquefaciens]UFD97699.1 VirB1-like [Bacillus amyloliquefaciens]WEG85224.1 bifunctional lytic transglycosylase/C40 family peptidase [Bacillus velezensis]WIA44724.1 bifunctional lytic transglycosylase/C40 family peptidase [Bacillus velezensis]